ncbi:hypothetical protein QQF64_002168 [Cirrhinus molitorella]|uniref:Uncharacterized protein n=1 Tax=Cirrhinus molitorella TaxID=172907 RepID=A0ABR3MPE2_9TELE
MLKPDLITLLLCKSQWRPSICLIGWLSHYMSNVGRQNTSRSFFFTWSLISPLTHTARTLWLTLTEMRDAEKRQLLNAPVSPQSLFRVMVETSHRELEPPFRQRLFKKSRFRAKLNG